MASASKPVFRVSVRELVEFALRRGDLGGERDFVGPRRALAGIRGHQKLQRSRPPGYEKEVPVSRDLPTDDFILRVQGRLDGLLALPGEEWLEEIKTVQGGWDREADSLHWAQAQLYASLYTHEHAVPKLAVRLVYLDLDTGEVTEFHCVFTATELAEFFTETTAIYLDWLREHHRWLQQRNQSLHALQFPFPRYRPGQRELAVAAYHTLVRGGRLFLEAPTGIGKTLSVLFPALKALGEGKLERIFYLTARTVGKSIAEQALDELRAGGLHARTLTLTAKDKVCFQARQPCDPQTCPLAAGYYDRLRPAMRAALCHHALTRPVLETVARAHQVCPFELSLDVSSWVDVVICDYNYVFDPKAYLRRHFGESPGDYAFLVDEAHNLVDRGREMFSAELARPEIQALVRALKPSVPRCAKALTKLSTAIRKLAKPAAQAADPLEPGDPTTEPDLFSSNRTLPESGEQPLRGTSPPQQEDYRNGVVTSREFPQDFVPLLEQALKEAETWLARNEPAPFRQELLELYFRLVSFGRTAELYDERFATIAQSGKFARVKLFCLDPSCLLRQALARGKAAVFFSATLTPSDYYRDLLGGAPEDVVLRLPSPFPPEHLAILMQDRIQTHFKGRAKTLSEVARALHAFVAGKRGNYLVYFPSYAYLAAVLEQFRSLEPATSGPPETTRPAGEPGSPAPPLRHLVQRPGMSEAEREAFLAEFHTGHDETRVGFAVMGGVFGEGIDLVGERLLGAAIIGVGLPQLCVERDLIRDYFQAVNGIGYDYAYTFPGLNRVFQAIGRVIRSESDRGVALLIDTRFSQARYRRLFPDWWQPAPARGVPEIRARLEQFWRQKYSPAKPALGK